MGDAGAALYSEMALRDFMRLLFEGIPGRDQITTRFLRGVHDICKGLTSLSHLDEPLDRINNGGFFYSVTNIARRGKYNKPSPDPVGNARLAISNLKVTISGFYPVHTLPSSNRVALLSSIAFSVASGAIASTGNPLL